MRKYFLTVVAIASYAMISCQPATPIKPIESSSQPDPNIAIQEKVNNSGEVAELTEAIRTNPNDATAYYNRGVVKFSLGDYQGALSDYSEAIRIKPSDVASYLNRGSAKRKLGDKQGAKADYEKAITIDKDGLYSEDSLRNLGVVESELGDKQAAISSLRMAAQRYQKSGKTDEYRNTLLLIQKIEKQP